MKKGLILLSLCFAPTVFANDVNFSLGAGYPYFVVPEVSWSNTDNQRWYAKYNLGLDDGFSVGFEYALDPNQQHSIGLLAGAVGVRDIDDCDKDDGLSGLACALGSIFDEHSIQGAALSYSYSANGLNQPGWRFRLEAGYGRVSADDNNYAGGNATISYQF